MQFSSSILSVVALAAFAVAAPNSCANAPGGPSNSQINKCSSGNVQCCRDGSGSIVSPAQIPVVGSLLSDLANIFADVGITCTYTLTDIID